ncbi:unnamed protein product, partial [Rotaria sp. Silwood1]
LPSGTVLVTGGAWHKLLDFLNSCEVYDPLTNNWTEVASMTQGRAGHTATLLSSGKVLVTGGELGEPFAELYDPVSDKWTPADDS